jgi:hypothetical protein
VAFIGVNRVNKYVGAFPCPFDAAQAYNFAAYELFGEFAQYNDHPLNATEAFLDA